MFENNRKETANKVVISTWHRNDIEKLMWKTDQYLVNLKVESTLKFPRRINVIISTWTCLSKSMKSRRTFHLAFRRRIDRESTKMCPMGHWVIVPIVSMIFKKKLVYFLIISPAHKHKWKYRILQVNTFQQNPSVLMQSLDHHKWNKWSTIESLIASNLLWQYIITKVES